MVTLEINGEALQLNNPDITLNLSASQLGELGTRNGVYSYTFDIPFTSVNHAILGYSNKPQFKGNTSPYKKYKAVIKTGINVLDGFIQIERLKDTYKANFFGNTIDWADKLKDRSLRDVDLSEYDHDYTKANIVASWDNTEGYTYPYINYGKLDGAVTKLNDWYPAVICKTLIDKIFKDIGYSVDGTFTKSFIWEHLIIPYSTENLFAGSSYIDNYNVIGRTDPTHVYAGSGYRSVIFEANQDKLSQLNASNGEITMQYSGTAQGDVRIYINDTSATGTLRVKKNGTVIQTSDIRRYTGASNFYFASISETFSFTSGDVFLIELDSTSYELNNEWSYFEIFPLVTEVRLQDTLPDIKQSDFIKYIAFIGGCLLETKGKTVYFNQFEDLKRNKPINWTQKVDKSENTELDFFELVKDYGKSSVFTKILDEDDRFLESYHNRYSRSYGSGVIELDNDFLDDEVDIVESPFSGSIVDKVNSTTDTKEPYLMHIPIYAPEEDGTFPNDPNNKVEPRIALRTKKIDVTAFTSRVTFTQISIDATLYSQVDSCYFYNPNLIQYPYQLAFDHPTANKFGFSLLEQNYGLIIDILKEPLLIKQRVKLTPRDIMELSFSTPVFLEQYNSRFYINKIEKYSFDRKSTEVELVRIP